jgi:hypothetical protein
MRVKCLGRVTPPHDVQVITAVPRPDYQDNKPEQEPYYPQYLELGSKRYSSGQIIESKDLYEKFIQKSKKEPQQICEISNKVKKQSKSGRLYLYKDKIYEFDRNDYNPQQVKLIILDFLEKEREEFVQLKRKYKS